MPGCANKGCALAAGDASRAADSSKIDRRLVLSSQKMEHKEMIRKLLTIAFLIALPLVSVFAQQKTDYSGTWKLNVAKSDYGPVLPGPKTSRSSVNNA